MELCSILCLLRYIKQTYGQTMFLVIHVAFYTRRQLTQKVTDNYNHTDKGYSHVEQEDSISPALVAVTTLEAHDHSKQIAGLPEDDEKG